VLGNEEDAADTLAATTLIRLDRNSPDSDYRYTRMLLMAADANRILWQRGLERDSRRAYWANHPLSVQRAARIACLVLGSDEEVFAALPELVDMPLFRAAWCPEEYALADSARTWVQSTYSLKSDLGRSSEPSVGYEAPGVVVSYTDDPAVKSGAAFAAAGVQVAAGVPLQCDEGDDFSTFRIGLFGLDKLRDIDRTVATLSTALQTLG